MTKLTVLATASAMVPDFSALSGGRRNYIGWKWDPALGDGVSTKGGFIRLTEPTVIETSVVEYATEYQNSVRCGDLVAVDDETARLCGVPLPTKLKAEPVVKAKQSAKDNDHD